MASFLPKIVQTKIYKTGQTRGADDDVIFQNRVGRNSTVLIPIEEFDKCKVSPDKNGEYENGFIVLVKPEDYFKDVFDDYLERQKLKLGENLLVFYETREQWTSYPILKGWKAAARTNPLGGQYVARVPATTSAGQSKIIEGFNSSKLKGAGIRVYEYSSVNNTNACRLQLELLFWSCKDIDELIANTYDDAQVVYTYIESLKKKAIKLGLFDKKKLIEARIIDDNGYTICPLCLKHMSAIGFCSKIQQAEGRDVPDLTVTEVSLFHIHELRTGEFNHRPYNLGWGHHHCNVVVKDSGIDATLQWMKNVLLRNRML